MALGFEGNPDLYGIGIRIGYYSTALSLWISHLWAPSEAHFLQPITLTFLVAMLIGVSVLSRIPANTFAIEPFMLMQISYYTFYMGLNSPNRPDHLAWERDYPKYFMARFIGLCLHGYDIWYWYYGIWLMKRTPGAVAYGLMLYFGRVDIFGYISYVMRVYVIVMTIFFIKGYIEALYQQWWEKKLDHEVPPSRLKSLADEWAMQWDRGNGFGRAENRTRPRMLLLPLSLARHASSVSVKSAPIPSYGDEKVPLEITKDALNRWRKANPNAASDDDTKSATTLQVRVDTMSSGGEPKLVRTMTDQLRKAFLGWQPAHSFQGDDRVYRYTPQFENVRLAVELLDAIYTEKCKKRQVLRRWWNQSTRRARLVSVLVTQPIRPRSLFAIKMHIRALSYTLKAHNVEVLRQALLHPSYSLVSAEDLVLASRIIMTLHPLRKPNRWESFAWAFVTFGTCSILMIGTELAIQWNYISGVQDIGSVGQLIPMAIGVCGLLKTIWTATMDRGHGETWCFGACRGSKKALEWADASEAYATACAAWQRRSQPDIVGDDKPTKAGAETDRDAEV